MDEGAQPRSGDILNRVADRQAEFSETANHLKRRLDRARRTCFALSFLGAALAATAAGLPDTSSLHPWLAVPAALMLGIGAFLTLHLLGANSVALHVKARMASEALKREAWLFAVASPPYDEPEARSNELRQALDRIEVNAGGLGLYEQNAKGSGSCPRDAVDRDGYLTTRLDGQIGYYKKAADRMIVPSRRLHGLEFVLALAAALTAIAAIGKWIPFDMAALTAVFTTLSGTIIAHLQASRYDELILSYRATANRLSNLQATLNLHATAADIAAIAEEIIGAETRSWQACWLKEDSKPAGAN